MPTQGVDHEREAIARLAHLSELPTLHLIDVRVDGRVVGFSVLEDIGSKTFLVHFRKMDRRLSGLPTRLAQEEARFVVSVGGEILNIEQDLGIPGLRTAKQRERPIGYLRKYTIEER